MYVIGKRFASPIKKGPREKRAKRRDEQKLLFSSSSGTVVGSSDSMPTSSIQQSNSPPLHTALVGQQFLTSESYEIHELPSSVDTKLQPQHQETDVTIGTALLARIEFLEAENTQLKAMQLIRNELRLEDIQHDDKLVCFFTGFTSYVMLTAFFEFLGPAVHNLRYWGEKEGTRKRKRTRKLDPKNQLFLTLVKLKLNFQLKYLALRFGLSISQTSRYFTTWICFLYYHLKEINWMPSTDQVWATLPSIFKEKYPTTYAIIDTSEIFIETPSDLRMQSSTWSQYKHHNTFKFLIACTPNGAICFVSPVYVGSISDVELTRCSGLLDELKDKPGITIMADKGFTIKDMLKDLHIELNIPPFLQDRQQLAAKEVEEGRKIAAVCIHVERAIGRMKTFSILKDTIPLSMARLSNQIVFVCAMLTNFLPVLVPLPDEPSESVVEEYFGQLSSCDTNSDDSDSS